MCLMRNQIIDNIVQVGVHNGDDVISLLFGSGPYLARFLHEFTLTTYYIKQVLSKQQQFPACLF